MEGSATMNSKYTRALGVVLALGGSALLSTAAQDKAVVATIEKQADDVGKKDWTALTKQGEEVAKKHELMDIMNLMKLRNAPGKVQGMGVGKEPGKIKPDGIDAKIINMSRNPMAQATLNREQPDLIRLAQITAAIASATIHQCPVDKKMGDKDPATWKKGMEEMHKASMDLIEALKKKDPKEVQKATFKLRGTCTDCHTIFRDSQ
jgi:hypothetical protein